VALELAWRDRSRHTEKSGKLRRVKAITPPWNGLVAADENYQRIEEIPSCDSSIVRRSLHG